jgi:hypothetical protein
MEFAFYQILRILACSKTSINIPKNRNILTFAYYEIDLAQSLYHIHIHFAIKIKVILKKFKRNHHLPAN